MELKSIRCFVAVAEARSVTRAAERLFMTQPALSRTIGALEDDLGIELLDHNARPIALTRAGEVFYEKSRRILKLEADLLDDMNRMKSGLHVTLRIQYGMGGHMPLIVKALERFQRLYPNVTTNIQRQYNAIALQNLKNRECDICLVNKPDVPNDRDFESAAITKECLYAFIPRSHALSVRDALSLSDLEGEKLCTFERFASPMMFEMILNMFSKNHISYAAMGEAPDTITFTLMLASYNMIGIMPKNTLVWENFSIKSIPIVGTEGMDTTAVWNKDQHNPSVQAFVDMFSE